METSQTYHRDEHQHPDCQENKFDDDRGPLIFSSIEYNGEDTPAKATKNEYGKEGDKVEEIFVVSLSNAVVHPGTVVVKALNTVITNTAVGTARWSVELAAVTPLHLDLHTINGDDPVQRMSAVILLICWLSRIYARVNKGGEEEGREYKKVQHSHVDCGKDWNDQSEARIVDAKYISDRECEEQYPPYQ